jgi:hypothetical protein
VRILWVPFKLFGQQDNKSAIVLLASVSQLHWCIGGSETSDPLYALRFWKVRESLDPTAVDDWT